MAQLIYAILALVMIMFLSMNMQRNVGRDQQEQALNEVATQLTSVGTGVLDQIGTRHFDRYTFANRNNPPYCGRIADNGEEQDLLSDPTGPYFGTCSVPPAPGVDPPGFNCNYIEGLKGVSEPIVRGDIEYEVTVLDVEYVNPDSFSVVSAVPTFAKKVTIEVTNPFLYVGDDPNDPDAQFSLTLERVFTYGCATDYDHIPFIRTSDPPPANQCPDPTPCAQWNW